MHQVSLAYKAVFRQASLEPDSLFGVEDNTDWATTALKNNLKYKTSESFRVFMVVILQDSSLIIISDVSNEHWYISPQIYFFEIDYQKIQFPGEWQFLFLYIAINSMIKYHSILRVFIPKLYIPARRGNSNGQVLLFCLIILINIKNLNIF